MTRQMAMAGLIAITFAIIGTAVYNAESVSTLSSPILSSPPIAEENGDTCPDPVGSSTVCPGQKVCSFYNSNTKEYSYQRVGENGRCEAGYKLQTVRANGFGGAKACDVAHAFALANLPQCGEDCRASGNLKEAYSLSRNGCCTFFDSRQCIAA